MESGLVEVSLSSTTEFCSSLVSLGTSSGVAATLVSLVKSSSGSSSYVSLLFAGVSTSLFSSGSEPVGKGLGELEESSIRGGNGGGSSVLLLRGFANSSGDVFDLVKFDQPGSILSDNLDDAHTV
eukprot:CAMPEP_0174276862 /NCGR_PEP_ID=MMETSP0439-20130205/60621_1 /TAXON_ID=0 /ORGANISM="Stereomyxa ramosa, Strain Chinc5" /LENGTH=124 /DNA_ID=CAMNT_0015369131 /DNA_START=724 /DNA_END=1098 /DNA_ORIENTATION=+